MSEVAVASQRYVLPYLPLGLRRVEAAAYVGVSPSKFDEMVQDKRMPKPIHIDGRRVWDRRKIEEAFAQLGEEGEGKRRSLADEII